MNITSSRTTISVNKTTKARMDKWRATGQCYDGFLCELVGLWERTHNRKHSNSVADFKHRILSGTGK